MKVSAANETLTTVQKYTSEANSQIAIFRCVLPTFKRMHLKRGGSRQ